MIFVVPCDSGTFWNSTSTHCEPCPVDTYQPFKNTTHCIPCGPGSYSPTPGALQCKGKQYHICNKYCSAVPVFRLSVVQVSSGYHRLPLITSEHLCLFSEVGLTFDI